MEGARSLALQRRVLLLWSAGGIGVDIAFGALPFEERCVEQASDWELSSVLVRQGRSLDWRLIVRELKPLLEMRETPENLERLRQLRSKIEKGA